MGNTKMITHTAPVIKVTAGGAGVGTVSYVVTEQAVQVVNQSLTMAEVQMYATLIAAICTGLYFFAAFILTMIKIYKEAHGKNTA